MAGQPDVANALPDARASSFAVIGPGRVGTALARLWRESGFDFLGFVGRREAAVAEAVQFCGAGTKLALADLRPATFVLVSVGDDELHSVVAQAAAAGVVRRCSLWLHCSGVHDVNVLAPLAEHGARIGAIHPLCPVPSAQRGYQDLPGRSALVQGGARAMRLLLVLSRKAGLVAKPAEIHDRALYHAACALSANGLTALADLCERLFAGSGAKDLHLDLMQAALDACRRDGSKRALTGPVARGDLATLALHRQALTRQGPQALPSYLALMRHAADMAMARGSITPARHAELLAVLQAPVGGDHG